jgi:hypothetical protein
MTFKNVFFTAIALAIGATQAYAESSPTSTLCSTAETSVFSCDLGSRQFALCRGGRPGQGSASAHGSLRYVLGATKELTAISETLFPAPPMSSLEVTKGTIRSPGAHELEQYYTVDLLTDLSTYHKGTFLFQWYATANDLADMRASVVMYSAAKVPLLKPCPNLFALDLDRDGRRAVLLPGEAPVGPSPRTERSSVLTRGWRTAPGSTPRRAHSSPLARS